MIYRLKRVLLLVVASVLLTSCGGGNGGSTGSTGGVVFSLDEGSGNVTYDSLMTLKGDISGGATWVTGKTGHAISFENAGSQIVANYNSLAGLESQKITAEAWINPSSIPLNRKALIVGDTFSWKLQLNSGKVEFWVNFGLGTDWAKLVSWDTVLSVSTWRHIAVTYNGSDAKMYVDGTVVATSSSIYSISFDPFHQSIFIGGSSGCCDFQDYIDSFPGAIDNVMIFNRVLSEADISATYNATK